MRCAPAELFEAGERQVVRRRPATSRARAVPSRAGGTAPRRARRSWRAERRLGAPRPSASPPSRWRRSPPRRARARACTAARRRGDGSTPRSALRSRGARPRGRGARCARSSRRGAGCCPLKRSSFASASSRIESRKCTRRFGSFTIAGNSLGERPLAVLVRVVEEVVLELVEDDEQRADPSVQARSVSADGLAGHPRPRLVDAERLGRRGPDRLHQRRQRIVAPGREGADRERRPLELRRAHARVRARAGRGSTPARRSEVLPTPLAP